MIRILGISGSPRRHGNTETLLDSLLEGAKSSGAAVEKIILGGLSISPCKGCHRCGKKGVCVVNDDMRLIYKKIDECDGLVIASPVYFGSVTAQLKAMVDRFEPYWVRKSALKKPVSGKEGRKGAFLCVAEKDNPEFFRNAGDVVRFFFSVLDIGYAGELFCPGLMRPGDAKKRPVVLQKSFRMGKKLSESV